MKPFLFLLILYTPLTYAFLPNTLIKIDNAHSAYIQTIEPGNAIFSSFCTQNKVWLNYKKSFPCYVCITLGDEMLYAAPNQKVYVANKNSWVQAKNLEKTDLLMSLQNEPVLITDIEIIHKKEYVHELSLAPPHIFYVGKKNILAHNFIVLPAMATATPHVVLNFSYLGATSFVKTACTYAAKTGLFCIIGKIARRLLSRSNISFFDAPQQDKQPYNQDPNQSPNNSAQNDKPPKKPSNIPPPLGPPPTNSSSRDKKRLIRSREARSTKETSAQKTQPSQKVETAQSTDTPPSPEKPIAPATVEPPVRNELENLDDALVKPLGRGSTGRTEPKNLHEQLAMKEAMSNPLTESKEITKISMTDPRWPKEEGWTKRQKIIYPSLIQEESNVNLHYVYNYITKQFDDFKFK